MSAITCSLSLWRSITIRGLLFLYAMNTGAPQGLLEGSITPNWIHASICLSITSRLAGETWNGGIEIGLVLGMSGISTSSA